VAYRNKKLLPFPNYTTATYAMLLRVHVFIEKASTPYRRREVTSCFAMAVCCFAGAILVASHRPSDVISRHLSRACSSIPTLLIRLGYLHTYYYFYIEIERVQNRLPNGMCDNLLRGGKARNSTRKRGCCSIAPKSPSLWCYRSRALGYLARLGLAYSHLQILTPYRST
jgi:hypothetical protein